MLYHVRIRDVEFIAMGECSTFEPHRNEGWSLEGNENDSINGENRLAPVSISSRLAHASDNTGKTVTNSRFVKICAGFTRGVVV